MEIEKWNQDVLAGVDIDKVPTIAERFGEFGFPIQVQMDDLSDMGEVVYLAAEEAQAANPDGSGEMTDGYFVTFGNPADGKAYTCFVGGQVLVRGLAFVLKVGAFPFRASIYRNGVGKGHPWLWNTSEGKK